MKTVKKYPYPLAAGFSDLAAGICCGLSGLAAGTEIFLHFTFFFFEKNYIDLLIFLFCILGMSIGIVGDAGVRSAAQQPQM